MSPPPAASLSPAVSPLPAVTSPVISSPSRSDEDELEATSDPKQTKRQRKRIVASKTQSSSPSQKTNVKKVFSTDSWSSEDDRSVPIKTPDTSATRKKTRKK